jgi:hypothetical protein
MKSPGLAPWIPALHALPMAVVLAASGIVLYQHLEDGLDFANPISPDRGLKVPPIGYSPTHASFIQDRG